MPTHPPTSYNFSPQPQHEFPLVVALLFFLFFLFGFFSIYLGRYIAQYVVNIRPSISLPRGLNPSIISSFPTFTYSSSTHHLNPKCDVECAICLAEFSEDDDDILRLLKICGHVFHAHCIDYWLGTHTTCPVCRCDLEGAGGASLKEVRIRMPEEEEEEERGGEEVGGEGVVVQRGGHLAAGVQLMRSCSTGHLANGEDSNEEERFSRWERGEENVKEWRRSRTWSSFQSHAFGEFSDDVNAARM